MKDLTRRNSLKAGMATMVTAAVAGVARPANAKETPNTPFTVSQTTIPILGSQDVFPVRLIYCIGRNYEAHSREMGSDPTREPPFFFQKPTDAIQFVAPGTIADHSYPSLTKNYHHEVELVAALKSGGKDIPVERALDHVYGYALGLDMTRRDLQRAMGNEKKPWEIGKSFDHAAPIGPIVPAAQIGKFSNENISLAVEGHARPDDLVGGRANLPSVRSERVVRRRHHLLRHPRKRRPGGSRRCHPVQTGQNARPLDPDRMIAVVLRTAALLAALIALPNAAAFGQAFDEAAGHYQAGEYAEALEIFQQLGNQGDARAQYTLGMMFDGGQGVAPDPAQAIHWFELAAAQGNDGAQYNLGVMAEQGRGMARDPAQALKWYRQAAEHGHPVAQYNLALLYQSGIGTARDDRMALQWFARAAQQGDTQAQHSLGMMLARGQGVAPDPVRGLMWIDLAAALGEVPAVQSAEQLAARMRPADVERARILASDCMRREFKSCG